MTSHGTDGRGVSPSHWGSGGRFLLSSFQGCCPWPWSSVVLKDKIAILGPGLGIEPSVLGPVLGLAC